MTEPSFLLSFALNPETDRFQVVSIPNIGLLNHRNHTNRMGKTQGSVKNNKIMISHTSGKMGQTANVKMRRNSIRVQMVGGQQKMEEAKDLNTLLTSLLEVEEWLAPHLNTKLNQIFLLGRETPVDLLVMMEYTQKISYIETKCSSYPFLTSACQQEVARVTELIFGEQEIYLQMLMQQFVPNG